MLPFFIRAFKLRRLLQQSLASSLCIVVASALVVTAHAAQPIITDSRIKTFVYNPNEVFAITTHYGYQSNIEFADREVIDTVSVGDRVAWQIIPAGRRLFIRAMEENAHTNMTIVTNQHSYQFDLRSSASDAVFGSAELTYVVRFYYPDGKSNNDAANLSSPDFAPAPPAANNFSMPIATGQMVPQQNAAPYPTNYPNSAASNMGYPAQGVAYPTSYPNSAAAPAPMMSPYAPQQQAMTYPTTYPTNPAPSNTGMNYTAPNYPTNYPTSAANNMAPYPTNPAPAPQATPIYNYRYTYSGPSDQAPSKIYDDGKTTYFRYKSSAMPDVSVITPKGQQLGVPIRNLPNNTIAVDVIAPSFSLKQGGSQVIVYNEAGGA